MPAQTHWRTLVRPPTLAVALGCAGALLAPASVRAQSATRKEWPVPARRAARPNPVPAGAPAVARGSVIYKKECEPCHGKAGRGDGEKARQLKTPVGDLAVALVQTQTDGALFYKITEGRGDMPTNRTTLGDEDRWIVVHYVRTLALK